MNGNLQNLGFGILLAVVRNVPFFGTVVEYREDAGFSYIYPND